MAQVGPPFDVLSQYFMEWAIYQCFFYQVILVELEKEQGVPHLVRKNQVVLKN